MGMFKEDIRVGKLGEQLAAELLSQRSDTRENELIIEIAYNNGE